MIPGSNLWIPILVILSSILSIRTLYGQQTGNVSAANSTNISLPDRSLYYNWVAFSPFSIQTIFTPAPWYYLEYGHQFDSKAALIIAADFGVNMSAAYFPDFWNSIPYPGHSDFFSLLIGYRYYLWEGLHLELDLLSGITSYYDPNKNFISSGWNGITADLKLGYKFDFELFKIPLFLSIQMQFVTSIYNEPDIPPSFREINSRASSSPVSIYPACQLGYRF